MSDPEYNPFLDKGPTPETAKAPKFGETRKITGARGEGLEINVVATDAKGKLSKAQKSGRINDLILDRQLNTYGKPNQTRGQMSQGVKNQKALTAVNDEISWEDDPAKLKKLRAAKKKIGQRIKKEGKLRNFNRFF